MPESTWKENPPGSGSKHSHATLLGPVPADCYCWDPPVLAKSRNQSWWSSAMGPFSACLRGSQCSSWRDMTDFYLHHTWQDFTPLKFASKGLAQTAKCSSSPPTLSALCLPQRLWRFTDHSNPSVVSTHIRWGKLWYSKSMKQLRKTSTCKSEEARAGAESQSMPALLSPLTASRLQGCSVRSVVKWDLLSGSW